MEALSYDHLLALVAPLQSQVAALTVEMDRLRAENRRLQEQIGPLQSQVAELQAENAALKAEVVRLQQERKGPPAFVKPPRPKPSETPESRKKRPMGFARKRETAIRTEEHRLKRCPDCGGPVSKGYEKRWRQVIELPQCPVAVTDHVLYGHWCGSCGKERVARVSPAEIGAVGEGRLGARLRSLIVLLRMEARLPFRTIRTLLSVQYGVSVSMGELVAVLHATAQAGEAQGEAIREGVRASAVVHGDETGWREAGQNGWLWSFSTPEDVSEPLRYYQYEQSRASAVVADVLGLDPGDPVELNPVEWGGTRWKRKRLAGRW